MAYAAQDTWRFGVWAFNTAGAESVCGVGTYVNSEAPKTDGPLVLGNGRAYFCAHAKVPVVSDATNTFRVVAGFVNQLGFTTSDGSITSGTFFSYTHGRSTGKWEAVYRLNGTDVTVLTTAAALTADRWYKLELETLATDCWATSPPTQLLGSAYVTAYDADGTPAARESLGSIEFPTDNNCLAVRLGMVASISQSVGIASCALHVDLWDSWYMDEYSRTPAISERPF